MRIFLAIVVAGALCMEMNCAASAPPPPPPVVVVPARPHPDAVWVPGHWQWKRWGHRYVWVAGHWKVRRGHAWVIIE